jgi:hypothetical protein
MAFLPSNIKAPSEGGGGAGNYMRFQQGDNKFRIIGSSDDKPTPGFICGTLGWAIVDGKKRPIRWAEGENHHRHLMINHAVFMRLWFTIMQRVKCRYWR